MQAVLKKLFPSGTFSADRVNTKRQIELDLLKGIAIIVMVLEHAYIELLSYDDAKDTLFDIIMTGYVTQLLNASVFMICMGMSVHYSRHKGANALAMRGIALLSVGQLLELLRTFVPNIIAYWISGNQFFIISNALIFSVDIMQLAGLTFLLFALLKKLKLKGWGVFLFACGLNLVGVALNGVETESYLVNQLLGYFYPTKTESFFPAFNWFIYPAFGYWFGETYQYLQDKDKFYNRIFLICLPLAALYFVPRYAFDFLHFGDYTQEVMQTSVILPDALVTIVLDLAVIGMFYKASKLFKGGVLPAAISFPAKHVNKYYCVSWVLIGIISNTLMLTRGRLLDDVIVSFACALGILAACTIIILFYERYLRKFFSAIPKPVVLALFGVVWVTAIIAAAWTYPRITEYPNYLNNYLLDQLGNYF